MSSCTIQKRTVNKGYFVQWHFGKKSDSRSQKSEPLIDENLVLKEQDSDSIEENEMIILNNAFDDLKNIYTSYADEKPIDEKKIEKSNSKKSDDTFFSQVKMKEYRLKKVNSAKKSVKYYDKKKGKKALICALITLGAILTLVVSALALLSPNASFPEWFYSIFLFSLLILSIIAIITFAILFLVFLILAFIKPKEKFKPAE